MSARVLVQRLIDAGFDPAEAGEVIALAMAEGARQAGPLRSTGAIRQQRWREGQRNKASQSVTEETLGPASQSVSKRNNVTPRDASRVEDNPSSKRDIVQDSPQKPSASTPPKVVRLKTRRCPPDWTPQPETLAVGANEGFTAGEIERELARFRDYQFRDAHGDWDAALRNWFRKAADQKPRKINGHHDPRHAARQANLARAWAGSEAAIAAAGRGGDPGDSGFD